MAATVNTIWDAVVAAVAIDHSAGAGTYNLSGSGVVVEGRYLSAPRNAEACVAIEPPSWKSASQGVNLNWYGRRVPMRINLWARGASNANTPAARRAAVANLAHDVATAIEGACRDAAGSLLNVASDVLIEGDTPAVGGEQDLPEGYGQQRLIAHFAFSQARGI